MLPKMIFVYKNAAKRAPARPRPRAGCKNAPALPTAAEEAEPAAGAAEDEPASVVAVGVEVETVMLPPLVTVANPVLALTIGTVGATGAAELATGAAELATGAAELSTGAAELATGATELTPAGVDATAG